MTLATLTTLTAHLDAVAWAWVDPAHSMTQSQHTLAHPCKRAGTAVNWSPVLAHAHAHAHAWQNSGETALRPRLTGGGGEKPPKQEGQASAHQPTICWRVSRWLPALGIRQPEV
ncbi:hypothetical protein C8Q80DRAFT_1269063 [Daedaleopsis nitida]|nr:hypothetical protein C8Q80DRAFT_1269063 [Daedaleopsis nitida]